MKIKVKKIEFKKSNSVPGSNILQVSFRYNHPNLNMFYLNNKPIIFQTMNSVRSSSLSLKYRGFTPSGC